MSRYTLDPIKPEHDGYEIVVGWDGTALHNFFGEVRRPRVHPYDLGGEIVISVAELRPATYDNLNKHFHEVVTAISRYAVISADLRRTLWADSKREGFDFRTPVR